MSAFGGGKGKAIAANDLLPFEPEDNKKPKPISDKAIDVICRMYAKLPDAVAAAVIQIEGIEDEVNRRAKVG
ncbi:hypothetical protein SPB21_04070 [Leptothoe sp. ISB3NOV94-8A]